MPGTWRVIARFFLPALLLLGLFAPSQTRAAQVEKFNMTGLWNFVVSDSGDSSFDGPHLIVIEQYGAYYRARELNSFELSIGEDASSGDLLVLSRYDLPTVSFYQYELWNITDGSGTGYAFKYITDGARYSGFVTASRVDTSIQTYDSTFALFIPHLTGADTYWTSYLSVANNSNDNAGARYHMVLFDTSGIVVFDQTYSLAPRTNVLHNLSELAPTATWGRMEMLTRGLEAKLTFQNQGGGLSQFALSPFTTPKLAFNFSNSFPDYVVWKGIVLTNTLAQTVPVTLQAVKDGSTVGQTSLVLESQTRIVGTSETWFPDLKPTDFDAIIARSESGFLTGLAISGDYSGLHFISAAPAYAPYY
jgi:hypothetical protein